MPTLLAPPLVGRDVELSLVDRALADGCRGRGGGLFLVGEPGSGKSRLAAETLERATRLDMVVLRGRATTMGPAAPFRALAEALLSMFRGGGTPNDLELGPYRSVLGRLIPDWDDQGASRHGESLIVLAEAVLRLVTAVGRERGCLLLLEDLHEADVETLAVVDYLCDNLAGQRVALVLTVRTEPSPALDLVRDSARRHVGQLVELARLGPDDVTRMVSGCLSGADVPPEICERIRQDSDGLPFVVEELLYSMVTSGRLALGEQGWRIDPAARADVPATLVQRIGKRAERLGKRASEFLRVAAVLGRRFPLSVVQRVTGLADEAMLADLGAAVAAHLLVPDERGPEWYAFNHPLTADALRAQITPARQAAIAAALADGTEALYPGLPGEWCHLAAGLRRQADQPVAAGMLFAEAGRRALTEGAAGSAVHLLETAEELLSGTASVSDHADVLETLLYALTEAGRVERALDLAKVLTEGRLLDPHRRLELHLRLAWALHMAGRLDEGEQQVAEARVLLEMHGEAHRAQGREAGTAGAAGAGECPHADATASVDAVAAFLALEGIGRDRLLEAETAATRAVTGDVPGRRPEVLCQAWHVIGIVARERDIAESNGYFERIRVLGEQHRLPIWHLYGVFGLAGNAWLAEGDRSRLAAAGEDARRTGALLIAQNIDAILSLDLVLRGRFGEAEETLPAVLGDARRLKLTPVERYLLVCTAALAAHRGRRAEMDRALEEFRAIGGDRSRELPLALGLARVFCSLLEEDPGSARAELERIRQHQTEYPTTFYLAGTDGLGLLLSVLDGRAGWARWREVAGAGPAAMRWNRQFILLAEAVLLGRDGDNDRALDAVRRAAEAAEPYPVAAHLGLRLVAEAAGTDGWGHPIDWLRRSEEFFFRADVPAVASACRALLRQSGASVQQRRAGVARVPAPLRVMGITVREYEVLELLAERLGNKAVAARLHISPRTVEKHVAGLMLKTTIEDRAELAQYAVQVLAGQLGRPAARQTG